MIARLSYLNTEIKANKKRIDEIDSSYDETKEKLILALENEKKDVHEQIKNLSEREFITIESKGKALRSGLEMQLRHCEEAESKLKDQHNDLYSQLQEEKRNRDVKMNSLKEEMNDGFTIRGKEILTSMEQSYLDIISSLKQEEEELRNKRHNLNNVVNNTKEQNKSNYHLLYNRIEELEKEKLSTNEQLLLIDHKQEIAVVEERIKELKQKVNVYLLNLQEIKKTNENADKTEPGHEELEKELEDIEKCNIELVSNIKQAKEALDFKNNQFEKIKSQINDDFTNKKKDLEQNKTPLKQSLNQESYQVVNTLKEIEKLRESNIKMRSKINDFNSIIDSIEQTTTNIKMIDMENDINILKQIYEHNKQLIDGFGSQEDIPITDTDCLEDIIIESEPEYVTISGSGFGGFGKEDQPDSFNGDELALKQSTAIFGDDNNTVTEVREKIKDFFQFNMKEQDNEPIPLVTKKQDEIEGAFEVFK